MSDEYSSERESARRRQTGGGVHGPSHSVVHDNTKRIM